MFHFVNLSTRSLTSPTPVTAGIHTFGQQDNCNSISVASILLHFPSFSASASAAAHHQGGIQNTLTATTTLSTLAKS